MTPADPAATLALSRTLALTLNATIILTSILTLTLTLAPTLTLGTAQPLHDPHRHRRHRLYGAFGRLQTHAARDHTYSWPMVLTVILTLPMHAYADARLQWLSNL